MPSGKKKNPMRLPWKVWETHIIDCDGNAIAFNVGRRMAEFIVRDVNEAGA